MKGHTEVLDARQISLFSYSADCKLVVGSCNGLLCFSWYTVPIVTLWCHGVIETKTILACMANPNEPVFEILRWETRTPGLANLEPSTDIMRNPSSQVDSHNLLDSLIQVVINQRTTGIPGLCNRRYFDQRGAWLRTMAARCAMLLAWDHCLCALKATYLCRWTK